MESYTELPSLPLQRLALQTPPAGDMPSKRLAMGTPPPEPLQPIPPAHRPCVTRMQSCGKSPRLQTLTPMPPVTHLLGSVRTAEEIGRQAVAELEALAMRRTNKEMRSHRRRTVAALTPTKPLSPTPKRRRPGRTLSAMKLTPPPASPPYALQLLLEEAVGRAEVVSGESEQRSDCLAKLTGGIRSYFSGQKPLMSPEPRTFGLRMNRTPSHRSPSHRSPSHLSAGTDLVSGWFSRRPGNACALISGVYPLLANVVHVAEDIVVGMPPEGSMSQRSSRSSAPGSPESPMQLPSSAARSAASLPFKVRVQAMAVWWDLRRLSLKRSEAPVQIVKDTPPASPASSRVRTSSVGSIQSLRERRTSHENTITVDMFAQELLPQSPLTVSRLLLHGLEAWLGEGGDVTSTAWMRWLRCAENPSSTIDGLYDSLLVRPDASPTRVDEMAGRMNCVAVGKMSLAVARLPGTERVSRCLSCMALMIAASPAPNTRVTGPTTLRFRGRSRQESVPLVRQSVDSRRPFSPSVVNVRRPFPFPHHQRKAQRGSCDTGREFETPLAGDLAELMGEKTTRSLAGSLSLHSPSSGLSFR
eukprot:TRINITY_DN7439_c0_g1_i1.p1 TRINITY_DN7439_c0_g1~~TRINITY_DN7439_c0_g1_i1.p1  ORF type:complete len:585 (+),score=126.95 TRINITY_DN7439_c0_g1_i1:118-1872(+)